MAAVLEMWAQQLLRRRGQPSTPSGLAGHRLVGTPASLTRVLAVRPGTIAVLLDPDRSPQVKGPGGVVVPPLLAPSRRPVVLPVCTMPVELTASVHGCLTFDGYSLEPVTVGFGVELDPGDGYAGLLALVTRHGTGVEAALLAAVHQEVARAVVGAIGVNRLADLQRSSLPEVLRGRWWPAAFAGGVLRSVHLDVAPVPYSTSSSVDGAGTASEELVAAGSAGDDRTAGRWIDAGRSGDPVRAGTVPAGTVPGGTIPVGAVSAGTVPVAVPVGAGPQPGEARREVTPASHDERYDDGEPTVPLPRVMP